MSFRQRLCHQSIDSQLIDSHRCLVEVLWLPLMSGCQLLTMVLPPMVLDYINSCRTLDLVLVYLFFFLWGNHSNGVMKIYNNLIEKTVYVPVKLCIETDSCGIVMPKAIFVVCEFNKIFATVKWSLCSANTIYEMKNGKNIEFFECINRKSHRFTRRFSKSCLQWSRTIGRVWSKPKNKMCNIIGTCSVQSTSGMPSITISVNSITATLHLLK